MNDSITIGVVKKQDNGSKVISLSSYQQLYDLVINSKLVPNAWYRFPYRSVNFLNGWVNADNNDTIDLEGFEPREVYTSDEEILLVQAISSFQISKTAYSEKYPQDIIEFQPYTNKLGVSLQLSNGDTLPNETEISNFDLQFDGTNVFFNMPAGYPALFGHFFYLYAEFVGQEIDEEITPGQILDFSFSGIKNTNAGFVNGVDLSAGIPKYNPLIAPENPDLQIKKAPTSTDGDGSDLFLLLSYEEEIPGEWKIRIKTGISPNGYQDLIGNGYAAGDKIYFEFDGNSYTYTLLNTDIVADRGAKIISSFSSTNGNSEGASFNVKTVEGNISYEVSLQKNGINYEQGEVLTIAGDDLSQHSFLTNDLTIFVDTVTTNVINKDYYQDGCFEPLTPNDCTCQFPYTSDEPTFNYGKAMSRIRVEENGYKIILLDLTEEDHNNYIDSTLFVETVEAISDAYGWVVKRTDKEKNISFPLDFRNRKYRRWNATYDLNLGLNTFYYHCISILPLEVVLTDYKDFKVIDNELYDAPESMNVTCSGGAIGGADAYYNNGFIENFVLLGSASNSSFGTKVMASTFGKNFNSNVIEEDCYYSILGDNFYDNNLKNIYFSIIGSDASNNKLKDISNSVTGNYFTENEFDCHIGNKDFSLDTISKTAFQKKYQKNSSYQIVRSYIDDSNELIIENI